jgi:DNA-binding NtrC family response regulator
MLAARLLAYRARALLDLKPADLDEAAACLVEAEGHLIGRRLHDLEVLARHLRRRLGTLGRDAPAGVPASGGPDPRAPVAGTSGAMAGGTPALRRVVALCERFARSSLPVLILGETGTGKELAARAIHARGPRAAGPFVTVACPALPAELLEAELFGCRAGAFSGADADRPGLIRSAQGGTFLFDGIGEMPLALQAKVLGALERGRVRPLGGTEEVEVDVRYLFTATRDLRPLVREGRFREDLYFRLRALELEIPPLRERAEDLPELVERFRADAAAARAGAPRFSDDALRALAAYRWPGNVRELKNVVTGLVLTASGTIGAAEVRPFLEGPSPEGVFGRDVLASRPLDELKSILEREYLLAALARAGGDIGVLAASLGIKRRALYTRLEKLGIRPRDAR